MCFRTKALSTYYFKIYERIFLKGQKELLMMVSWWGERKQTFVSVGLFDFAYHPYTTFSFLTVKQWTIICFLSQYVIF